MLVTDSKCGSVTMSEAVFTLDLGGDFNIVELWSDKDNFRVNGLGRVATDAGALFTPNDICTLPMKQMYQIMPFSTVSIKGLGATGNLFYKACRIAHKNPTC